MQGLDDARVGVTPDPDADGNSVLHFGRLRSAGSARATVATVTDAADHIGTHIHMRAQCKVGQHQQLGFSTIQGTTSGGPAWEVGSREVGPQPPNHNQFWRPKPQLFRSVT